MKKIVLITSVLIIASCSRAEVAEKQTVKDDPPPSPPKIITEASIGGITYQSVEFQYQPLPGFNHSIICAAIITSAGASIDCPETAVTDDSADREPPDIQGGYLSY